MGADAKFLYHSVAHDRAAQEILGGIGRRDRLVVVTGEFGTGKTTLCRTVLEELDRRTLTAYITEPFVSIDELLKALLVDFGVMSRESLAWGLTMLALGGAAVAAFIFRLTRLPRSFRNGREDRRGEIAGFLGEPGLLTT